MAAPNRRSSTGVDRRASTRLSMPQRHLADDDYDLESMGISDGFRPTDLGHNRIPSQTSQRTDRPLRRNTPPPRPSSTTKPKFDSFALRHDGAMGPIGRNITGASSSSAIPTRSSSVSTDMAFVRPESPYQGPSGPSHPYQMYPQESRLARTASVATTSTVQVSERSYTGPSGPTHPYGMYPQNTVPEAESTGHTPPIAPVPVGFPGLNNNYQRRQGPEGEEIADIIGPDGHTEQLPPYTQYPDEVLARKTRPMVQIPLAGAGGIGLATRNPEFASHEDLNTPQSRQSTMSDLSNHQVNTAARAVSEKSELKKWQKVARRKVCAIIPIWAIVLAAIVVVLFGIILGAVLAALKPKHPPKHHVSDDGDGNAQSIVYTTMTTTFDATPFTTVPSGVPTLPTGTYALPISVPSTIQNSCILNSAQSSAWSCSIPQTPLQIAVQGLPGSNNLMDNEAIIDYGNNSMTFFPYGTQPPVLDQAQVLSLVTDSQDPERGPAWFFQLPYNKVVIVEEDALTPSTAKRSSNSRDNTAQDFMRRGVAQPGDMPWFCYWNGTLLETFIYVNLTSSSASQSASTITPSPYPPTRSPMYGGASQSSTSTNPSSVPTSGVQSYGTPSSGSSQQPQFVPGYPKVIKVEERRIPRSPQTIPPYCVQHIINPDGSAVPALNSTNQPITIYLNETEPTTVSPIQDKRTLFGNLEERDGDLSERQSSGSCGCVWLAT